MPAIVLDNLSLATIHYNGVQFGGGDSEYQSTPPTYRFQGQYVYDDSGRTIKWVLYTLQVDCIFNETNELDMANNMLAIRQKLSEPGKQLKILGLGTAFDTIDAPGVASVGRRTTDVNFGPKPISFNAISLGRVAWQCTWVVQFTVSECLSIGNQLFFAAFNFDTTWENDFEGLCTRTISGYAEIATRRTGLGGRFPDHIADELRNQIEIVCPGAMRRVRNVWRENSAHNRLDFVVTDEALPGDYLPQGITRADGSISYDSAGPGFAQASITYTMNLVTAPDKPRALGGTTFMAAALSKYGQLLKGNPKGTVIPMSLSLNVGKFDRARYTNGSMTFALTKCLTEMLNGAGLWQPFDKEPNSPGSHILWRASIEHLWKNRGINELYGLVDDAVVVDLCAAGTHVSIGNSPSKIPLTLENPQFTFQCPDIPPDGGWIAYDLQIKVHRVDNQSQHRFALAYIPSAVSAVIAAGASALGSPEFSQSQAQQHPTEYHGLPTWLVLLEYKMLRFKHTPEAPILVSIGGLPVTFKEQQREGPKIAFDILTCPAYYLSGWKLYTFSGNLSLVKKTGSKTSCAEPLPSSQVTA